MEAAQEIKQKLRDPVYYIPRYFKIMTKDERLVPMELWKPQRYYIENRANRNICLKNRQQGFSCGVMADNSHALFTKPYQRMSIITHDEETSSFLFQTVQRFYRNLPRELQPSVTWSSGTRMLLDKMDSYIFVDSAKSDSPAIGRTLSRCHLSEMAKWHPRKAHSLFADISQTVPESGILTVESTPMGRTGKFYELYAAAKKGEVNYKVFFFPWWWDVTCRRSVKGKLEYDREERELIQMVLRSEDVELTPEQIQFRREKIAEIGELFYQEYPENDVDCWLSSDIGIFDGLAIRRYLMQCWSGKEDGPVTIWKDVIGGEKYVIGVDVAAGKEKGDFSVAAVLNVKRNEYVARLRGRIPPDLFTEHLMRLAKRYNDAEIAVERAGHGHMVIRILLENDYPNIYYHYDYDVLTQSASNEPGWKTSIKTKPLMVDMLATALRAGDIGLWSENFCDEASGMMWEGQTKVRTAPGGYDDEVDALMIALQVRSQAPIESERFMRRVASYISL